MDFLNFWGLGLKSAPGNPEVYHFETANLKLEKINQWFISNKLSLNVSKTKYPFVYKPSKKDDIPLLLPKLNIRNCEVERSECLKFLGVLLDENLC